MSKETLAKSIREIPDFPIPGILFYDVTTLFKNPSALQELSDTLYEMYKDKGITKVVGIESRGFIMGPILATRLGAGFVPMRNPENYRQKQSRKATIKNTAKIRYRYTKMLSNRMMSYYCMTTSWLQVEPWKQPANW